MHSVHPSNSTTNPSHPTAPLVDPTEPARRPPDRPTDPSPPTLLPHAARQAARRRRWYLRGARRDLEVQTGIDANDALTRASVYRCGDGHQKSSKKRENGQFYGFTDFERAAAIGSEGAT